MFVIKFRCDNLIGVPNGFLNCFEGFADINLNDDFDSDIVDLDNYKIMINMREDGVFYDLAEIKEIYVYDEYLLFRFEDYNEMIVVDKIVRVKINKKLNYELKNGGKTPLRRGGKK